MTQLEFQSYCAQALDILKRVYPKCDSFVSMEGPRQRFYIFEGDIEQFRAYPQFERRNKCLVYFRHDADDATWPASAGKERGICVRANIVPRWTYRGIQATLDMLKGTPIIKPKKMECECGTKAPPSQNHSGWCDLFRSEF